MRFDSYAPFSTLHSSTEYIRALARSLSSTLSYGEWQRGPRYTKINRALLAGHTAPYVPKSSGLANAGRGALQTYSRAGAGTPEFGRGHSGGAGSGAGGGGLFPKFLTEIQSTRIRPSHPVSSRNPKRPVSTIPRAEERESYESGLIHIGSERSLAHSVAL